MIFDSLLERTRKVKTNEILYSSITINKLFWKETRKYLMNNQKYVKKLSKKKYKNWECRESLIWMNW